MTTDVEKPKKTRKTKAQAPQAQNTVTINDKVYLENELPEKIKKQLEIYRLWEAEASQQRIDLAKTEAALRQLAREIAVDVETPQG